MKKLLYVIVVLLATAMSSCSSDDGIDENLLLGEWKSVYMISEVVNLDNLKDVTKETYQYDGWHFILYKDNKGVNVEHKDTFYYFISGNTISFAKGGEKLVIEELTADMMRLTRTNDIYDNRYITTWVLTKVGK